MEPLYDYPCLFFIIEQVTKCVHVSHIALAIAFTFDKPNVIIGALQSSGPFAGVPAGTLRSFAWPATSFAWPAIRTSSDVVIHPMASMKHVRRLSRRHLVSTEESFY